MTPAQLLDSSPVHSIGDAARILGHTDKDGQPRRRIVRELIREGKLRLVDDTQGVARWTVSAAELRRYIAEGPHKEAS